MINKIKSIIRGYKNLIWTNEELEPWFKERLDVCSPCPYNLKGICTACGCVIAAKTRSPVEQCPMNYWNPKLYCDENNQEFRFYKKDELYEGFKQFFKDDIIEEKEYLEFINHIDKTLEENKND